MVTAIKAYKPLIITLGAELADKQERGRRIMYVRNVAACNTRQAFCQGALNVSPDTVRQWENGYMNGLTPKGAAKIVAHANELNVYCSVSWLMYGIGHPPTYKFENFTEPDETIFNEILDELMVFHQKNNAVEAIIQDDCMSPQLNMGDFVGGVVVENLRDAVDRDCIVIDTEGNRYVRILRYSDEPDKYNLAGLNSRSPEKIIEKITIERAAPILWIRRPQITADHKV